MLLSLEKAKQERVEAIKQAADALQTQFGDLAYSKASARTRIKGLSSKQLSFAWEVRREIAKRVGHLIEDGNATQED